MKVDLEKLRTQADGLQLKTQTNGLQLKVDYPIEVETYGQTKLEIATKYHLLKVHKLAYLSEEKFGYTYKLTYNKFNKQ